MDSIDDEVERLEQNVGLAEAFLRGGVPNYVGTYWPVADNAAEKFAAEFYAALLAAETLGEALRPEFKAYARQIIVRANIDESRRPWRRERST